MKSSGYGTNERAKWTSPVPEVWYRAKTFYDTVHFAEFNGEMVEVDIPSDFSFNTFSDHVIVHCKSEWDVAGSKFVSGSVVAHPKDSFLAGKRDEFTVLYNPKVGAGVGAS